MTGSRLGGALVALALLAPSAACSSDADAPTAGEAGTTLAGHMDTLRDDLADGVEPVQPWQVTDDAGKDHPSGCADGKARRTYAATLVVPDPTHQDAEGREAKLLGKLAKAGWEPEPVKPTGDEPAVVAGTRTGSSVRIGFTPLQEAWRYVVTARTACLEKG